MDSQGGFWPHCGGTISVWQRGDSRPARGTGRREGESGSGKTSRSQGSDGVHPEERIVKAGTVRGRRVWGDAKLSQE